jgi:hypothetical protein
MSARERPQQDPKFTQQVVSKQRENPGREGRRPKSTHKDRRHVSWKSVHRPNGVKRDNVNFDPVQSLAPDVSWHRVKWTPKDIQSVSRTLRNVVGLRTNLSLNAPANKWLVLVGTRYRLHHHFQVIGRRAPNSFLLFFHGNANTHLYSFVGRQRVTGLLKRRVTGYARIPPQVSQKYFLSYIQNSGFSFGQRRVRTSDPGKSTHWIN